MSLQLWIYFDILGNNMVQETGWICPKCGQFNALTHVCAGCGMRPGRVPEATEPLQQRVHEDKIARVLNLIAHPPNFRIRPIEGDLAGDFNAWFDGGAIHIDTGSKRYFFTDQTKVWVSATASWLWIQIKFPGGEQVDIRQVKGPEQRKGR